MEHFISHQYQTSQNTEKTEFLIYFHLNFYRIKEKLIGLEADLADKTSKLSVRTNELSVLTIEKRTLEDKLASIAQQVRSLLC